jgi:hypothetical protein
MKMKTMHSFETCSLRSAILLALSAGFCGGVSAQNTGDSAVPEEIVVTGTSIKGVAPVGSNLAAPRLNKRAPRLCNRYSKPFPR